MDIHATINLIAQAVGTVGKDSKTETGARYSYRGIDAVVNALAPLMSVHGLITVPTVLERETQILEIGARESKMVFTHLRVAYDLYALDGSSIRSIVDAEAMDSGDKATSKAMSVAWRTMLIQVFALATGDAEPETTNHDINSTAHKADGHDYWANPAATVTPQGRTAASAPNCAHGAMKYWQSSKTGKAYYFCSLDKDDPEACKAVTA